MSGESSSRYFGGVRDLLEPGGTFLNHGIVTRNRRPGRVKPTFVNTYVFPDGELTTVDAVIGEAEQAGLELRDAESLRTSYALTLQHWVDNLETNREAALKAADETTYRIWRLYMAGSAIAFERRHIDLSAPSPQDGPPVDIRPETSPCRRRPMTGQTYRPDDEDAFFAARDELVSRFEGSRGGAISAGWHHR